MPVYEYFCPHCYRELEILRPIRGASEYSDCPDCGGKAWRLISGFGSRTGSYLQPSGMPFRTESGWQASERDVVATVTKGDADTVSQVGGQQAPPAVEMSWLLESQPNGSNLWSIPDWGIASILRYLREDLDVKLAEATPHLDEVAEVRPVERPVGAGQPVEYANVRPWPEEKKAAPVKATESDARLTSLPMVAHGKPSAAYRSGKPAMEVRPKGRSTVAPRRRWLPSSYFGWFLLLMACIAVVVVPLVWILAAIA